ncbi:hypothetical protein BGX24_006461, partial [Mortierella sp. AD032]
MEAIIVELDDDVPIPRRISTISRKNGCDFIGGGLIVPSCITRPLTNDLYAKHRCIVRSNTLSYGLEPSGVWIEPVHEALNDADNLFVPVPVLCSYTISTILRILIP